MRDLCLVLLLLFPAIAHAQSLEVDPGDLTLSIEIEETGHQPMVGEQVILTIRGAYRRHITRETLVQPDLAGFNWSQLGPDNWTDERIRGQKVKIFTRRMALYPAEHGQLEIGAFSHDLTLTDEGDDWFDHTITSEPLTIEVAPAPPGDGWWFPVRRLEISDQWSNAPDQLKPGEGVLRVIRLEAHGATPEMIPPMPELSSPSAMIFPHPPKRLVELTPEGPVTYAFWRWTIRPGNDVSTVVEPITLRYFDTTVRESREVRISPQRVAYGSVVPETVSAETAVPHEAVLPGQWAFLAGGGAFLALLWQGARHRERRRGPPPRWLDPLTYRLLRAGRRGTHSEVRAVARQILQQDPDRQIGRSKMLKEFDLSYFKKNGAVPDLSRFAWNFLLGRKSDPRGT